MLLTGAQTVPAIDEPLKPTGKWDAEFGENLCLLSRSYGAGADAIQLAILPMPGSNVIELVMTLPEGSKRGGGSAKVELLPAGTGTTARTQLQTKDNLRLLSMSVSREELGDLAAARSIRITRGGKQPVLHFAVPGMAKASEMLAVCANDLLRSWGLTPEMQARIVTPTMPSTNPEEWVENYPGSFLARGVQGKSSVRFRVSENGRASECGVVRSSGSTDLDVYTCSAVVHQGRFVPAKAADGTPVPSISSMSFSWVIES